MYLIRLKLIFLISETMKAQTSSWNLTISAQCNVDFAYATSNMDTVLFSISKNFTWTISFNINNDPWNEFRLYEKIRITWKILLFKKCKMFDQCQTKTDLSIEFYRPMPCCVNFSYLSLINIRIQFNTVNARFNKYH